MNTLAIIVVVFGCLNTISTFFTKTENMRSAIVYKVIPFLGGITCVIFGLQYLNVINILP